MPEPREAEEFNQEDFNEWYENRDNPAFMARYTLSNFWDNLDWRDLGTELVQSARDFFTSPETGEGSQWDSAYTYREYFGDELSGEMPNTKPGMFADEIVASAYSKIGTDVTRPDEYGNPSKSFVCTAGVCDIVDEIMPWPEDERGIKSVFNPYIEDAFSGIGPAGRQFGRAEDFDRISDPNELAKGDIMILNIERHREGQSPNAGGTHAVVVTGVYDDKIEIVHEGGQLAPLLSKYYDRDFLDHGKFRSAFRYNPKDVDAIAFNRMNIGG